MTVNFQGLLAVLGDTEVNDVGNSEVMGFWFTVFDLIFGTYFGYGLGVLGYFVRQVLTSCSGQPGLASHRYSQV